MFPNLHPGEMLVIGLFAVLLFGKRLPEVGKMLGRGIVEFKKGLSGIGDDDAAPIRGGVPARQTNQRESYFEPEVPKFEPPSTPPNYQAANDNPTYRD